MQTAGENGSDLDNLKGGTVCTQGITKILHVSKKRWQSFRVASYSSGIQPVHKNTGKHSLTLINEEQMIPLNEHFKYLLEFGEVQATK